MRLVQILLSLAWMSWICAEDIPYFGITVKDINGNVAIEEVFRGSPAELSGFMTNDVLVSINDKEIEKMDLLVRVIRSIGPDNNKFSVTINRGTEKISINSYVLFIERKSLDKHMQAIKQFEDKSKK